MIKLLLYSFFLFITFRTNAAIVQPTELSNSPIQFLEQKKNKTTPTQPQRVTNDAATIQATEPADNPIKFLEQNKNHTPTFSQQQQKASHNAENIVFNTSGTELIRQKSSNQSAAYSLETFTKKLNTEYGDNELVQKSLSTLYEVKQIWDDADSLANDFTSDVFFSLKLDKFINNDLTTTQHSLQNSSAYVFLKKDIIPSNQHHQNNGISFYQVQQAQANTSAQGLNPLISRLVASLFQVSTLYYLFALSILFMILQWAFKFVLRLFP